MHEEEKNNDKFLSSQEELMRCAIREQLFFFKQQHFPYAREVAQQLEEFYHLQVSVQRTWINKMYENFWSVLEKDATRLLAAATFQLGFVRRDLKRLLAQERREKGRRPTPSPHVLGSTRGTAGRRRKI